MADDFADSEKGNSLGIAESRAHSRTPMRSLAYIELSDDNGGLILNISEDGLAVQAVQMVSAEQLSHMRFRLPKTSIPIEVMGRLVWQLRSKKEAGIQFVNLSDEARQGIREWIGAEASRPFGEPEPPRRGMPQAAKPVPVVEPPPVLKTNIPVASPATVVGPSPSTSPSVPASPSRVGVPPKAKPKEPRPPVSKPPLAPPASPMPPSPAQPITAAGQSESTILVQQPTVLPASGPAPPPAQVMTAAQPAAGSAFPAGQVPLRPAARAEIPGTQSPMPGTVPNMPRWNGYVAPGLGMRYQKRRGWWTYTAALGVIAAVGFAGLMMIDPSTISRARLATAEHQPDPNANVPQAFATNSGNSTAPVTNPPIPAANGSGASNASPKPPQQTPAKQMSPNPENDSASDATGSGNSAPAASKPAVPVNPLRATGSTPESATTSGATNKKPSSAESAAEENKPAKREAPAREPSREESAAQPAKNNTTPTEAAQPNNQPPASQTQTSLTNGSNSSAANVQPQPTPPASSAAAPAAAPPVQSPTTQPLATQPSPTQKDQDDYARTAKREGVSGAGSTNRTPTQETSPAHTTTARPSVEVPGERSSPVTPSVPLIGVPSGSVGANSQFRSFRIPPELQSKAAQLAGSLQIGQMLSSYAPSYPVDAARAGVEGTVKLDVMVAPNGNVESVKVISGPPALTAVSISAVKGWHYGETLLGGQPVEAEQYVTLIFRLAK